jgi:hypothetical protein
VETLSKRLNETPLAGLLGLVMVWCGMALGHTLVVLQVGITGGYSILDSIICLLLGCMGFALVWIGMKLPENQATVLGYVGGSLIWVGPFEWTWRYSSHMLNIQPIMDAGMPILSGELLMIQATTFIVISMLLFLGANKDTRCRMFMWFHRNLGMRPGQMTPGYKRQHARNTALETVFLIWTIYLFAIYINDPRGIHYASTTAVALTVGFVVWGIYLITKLVKIRGIGTALRYAIPTGSIMWLPIEGFSRWGLYPEVWVKPIQYPGFMLMVLAIFTIGLASMYRNRMKSDQITATS